ncbi:MAG: uroporphyrinogen decarboxylase family protein [Rectinemataceae bacterium]
MIDIQKPDKHRLLAAFARETWDRVPNLELVVMRRNLEAILGTERLATIREDYRNLRTIWPPRSEDERHDRSILAGSSCYLPLPDYQKFLECTGQDAAVCTLSWKPKSRVPKAEGVVAQSQDGIMQGREDLHLFPAQPDADEMITVLDKYISHFRGTGIGVGVILRSVFCNTYETLGIENFMYKLYDDPGLLEELFLKFHAYSRRMAELVAERDIDFLIIDDDLCDNSGFMVNPQYLRDHWVPITKDIIAPVLSKGVPVLFHCCGNVRSFIPMIVEMGGCGIHPVQPNCNDIYAYKREFGKDICFIGNMDIAGVLARGTPEEVTADTKKHIDGLARGGGYVVCSSHSIIDAIPPRNYQAMRESVIAYGRF